MPSQVGATGPNKRLGSRWFRPYGHTHVAMPAKPAPRAHPETERWRRFDPAVAFGGVLACSHRMRFWLLLWARMNMSRMLADTWSERDWMDALGQRYNQEASNDQCKEANRIQLCPQSQYRARHSDRCKATTEAEVVRLMGLASGPTACRTRRASGTYWCTPRSRRSSERVKPPCSR